MFKINKLITLLFLSFLLCSEQVLATETKESTNLSSSMVVRIEESRFTDDLDDLIRRRVIRVLVSYNNTNFFILDGQIRGFEYELIEQYRKYLKTRVRKRSWPVTFVFVPVPFDQLIPALIEGKGDIAAGGLTITPDREKHVQFTKPYISGISEVVLSAKNAPLIKKLRDLAGKKIYVGKGTSYVKHLKELNGLLSHQNNEPVKIIEVDSKLVTEDILQMLNAGIIQYTIADSHIAKLWASALPDIKVYDQLAISHGSNISWAVRKENPELLKSLNKVVGKRKQGTLIGNVLLNRYFSNTKFIENPLTIEELQKLEQLKKLFQDYGKKYKFDWLILAALAFQESRLVHETTSSAGAIGIMQLMPDTAKGHPIKILDIHEVENNIHAGTKYMAFLRDEYFSDPEIMDHSRMDFILAAYNAGPTRINRLRRIAKQRGLDPNKWFSNVEQIARASIGRETVEYVANINKYYFAYNQSRNIITKRSEAIKMINNPKVSR